MECCLKSKYGIDSVEQILPHRSGMLLVDGVSNFELDKSITTFFNVTNHNIFLDDNKCVGSFVAFECIAQSVGLYNGIKSVVLNDGSTSILDNEEIGFLVGISNLVCIKPFVETGTTIIVFVNDIDDTGQMIKAHGVVRDSGGNQIMYADVSIMLQN